MGFKFNPFTGNFDQTDSPNGVFDAVEINGALSIGNTEVITSDRKLINVVPSGITFDEGTF